MANLNRWKELEWGTHLPLLTFMLERFSLPRLVEIGLGRNSTPLIARSEIPEVMFIENDETWVEELRKTGCFGLRSNIIVHNVSPISQYTSPHDLSPEVIDELRVYYASLLGKLINGASRSGLLFVDNYRALRTIAINSLYPAFNFIMYHDCQPDGVEFYDYWFSRSVHEHFSHFVLTTPTSWTGLFVINSQIKEFSELAQLFMQYYISEYCRVSDVDAEDVTFMTY